MLISIVSSIYNGAKFFPKLFESIVKQNLPVDDYEIVITDNASIDNTSHIVRQFQNDFPEIPLRLIRLEKNVGPGGGRNSGIKNAKGDFIINIDSDDTFIPESLIKITEKLREHPGVDLLLFDYKAVENNVVKEEKHFVNNSNEIMSGEDFIATQRIPNTPWCYAYNRNFLLSNSIFYAENVRFEDADFTVKATLLASKIFCYPIPVIQYNMWPGMGSRIGNNIQHLKDYFEMNSRLKDIVLTFNFIKPQAKNTVINIHHTMYAFLLNHFVWRLDRNEIYEILNNFKPYTPTNSLILKGVERSPLIFSILMSILRPFLKIASNLKNR